MESTTNTIFNLATDIIKNTSQSVFLTGKAGTGKTTFLRHICNTVEKNIIVAAPTGVAAINAGGVTLHSLLQLPFEPFIPDFEGKKKLDYHLKMRKSKIEMLQELELLIIDEVSMLRVDMLDAVDFTLRRYRNRPEPFGGVQMLYIGDLFQLPPVAQKHEWDKLRNYYASPFFFHAQALDQNLPLYIELKTVYRQSDGLFIDLLSKVRNNQISQQDLAILNERYDPNFNPPEGRGYVTLCTHNYKADQINKSQLEKLKSKAYTYKGAVGGDFSENSLPTEMDLVLKKGAQVMFVKNDAGEQRRYYNGKLATIDYLTQDKITVQFENGHLLELEKETWRNVRYTLNEKSGEIEEEEIGHFSQFPIRLAWAITIHKSQGLTFEKVIIDAGQAFAAGQVYVALSRCTTLDGIVLYSRITPASISTDREALAFAREEKNEIYLEQVLQSEKPRYCAERLKKNFDWATLIYTLRSFYALASEKKIPNKEETMEMIDAMQTKACDHGEIAVNFCKELDRILYQSQNLNHLKERVQKAVLYFHNEGVEYILNPLNEYVTKIKNVARIKLYQKEVYKIQEAVNNFYEKLTNVSYDDVPLVEDLTFKTVTDSVPEEKPKVKAEKGDTQRITLAMYKIGRSVKDIAKERNLKPLTIESHLISFIPTGEVLITDLLDEDKVKHLSKLLTGYTANTPLKEIKDNLPAEYSYFEIKAVMMHLKK